jgi:hypothetical protein
MATPDEWIRSRDGRQGARSRVADPDAPPPSRVLVAQGGRSAVMPYVDAPVSAESMFRDAVESARGRPMWRRLDVSD